MSQRISPATGAPYRLAWVCRLWRMPRCSVYRRRSRRAEVAPSRRGPVGATPDATLLRVIRDTLASSPFHGEGYRKVWARLRYAGIGLAALRPRRDVR